MSGANAPGYHMRWDDHDDPSRGFWMVSVSDLLAGGRVELVDGGQ